MVSESLHSPGMLRPQQERGSRALGWADNVQLVLLVTQGTLARLPTASSCIHLFTGKVFWALILHFCLARDSHQAPRMGSCTYLRGFGSWIIQPLTLGILTLDFVFYKCTEFPRLPKLGLPAAILGISLPSHVIIFPRELQL